MYLKVNIIFLFLTFWHKDNRFQGDLFIEKSYALD